MNYYPYFNSIPYMSAVQPAKAGLLKGLFGNISFSSILNGTQKTLGIVNQAIPLIKQAKPVLDNAKTMFKVMNEFKKTETPLVEEVVKTDNNIQVENTTKNIETPKFTNNGPVFFQ